ncbi:MAG: cytochrome C oxidase subunit IV family protein [Acidobacteriota bacterium]
MSHHVVSRKVYLAIFLALMVLTVVTVAVAFVDLGVFNDIVMLTIAVTKAVLVILYFMHVKYSGKLTALTVIAGFFFFVVMILLIMMDYWTRGFVT